jgi:uncharacterized membrane protein YgdD (TMEM256/DUF423 family)
MNRIIYLRISIVYCFFAVVLGAFGAHAVKNILLQNQTTSIWEKAVFYHFIHAVVLFILSQSEKMNRFSFKSFAVGILFFSGSLYILALTNLKWLGAITPLGGFAFLIGWLFLFLNPTQKKS